MTTLPPRIEYDLDKLTERIKDLLVDAYTLGTDAGYNTGYEDGRVDGESMSSEEYDRGYEEGIHVGREAA